MADLAPISAFANLPLAGRGVVAQERHGLSIATVMARRGQRGALAAAVREQFDIALPQGPLCAHSDSLSLLGTGPGRWLAIHSAPQRRFFDGFSRQLEGLASVVDQSGALGVLRLSGPRVVEMLAKGVAIDLDATAFPLGHVAVTQIAHIGVTLWKVDEAPSFDIAVARSTAGSFAHWLQVS
ncbi:MAG: sarcosine oxidase gamma subunit [Tardiphaga sp.]|nr:sarcosine oxidase gamma subunit [Tardiphaga sp.]